MLWLHKYPGPRGARTHRCQIKGSLGGGSSGTMGSWNRARQFTLNMFWSDIALPPGSNGKESAYSAGDRGSIPGLRRSAGEGHGNPLQYSSLKDPMDGRAWQATVRGVPKSQT